MSEPLVSVLLPVLDERRALPGTLCALDQLAGRFEVIVADGGSTDGSVELACAHSLRPRVVRAMAGTRGGQLNAAAAEARGDVLLFLHADTRLPPTAYTSIATALADPRILGGNFRLAFDGDDRFSRLAARIYAIQRRLGVYYGDSAVFVRAGVFRELGGFRELPIMEDYDLARRLERRGRTVCLPDAAVTSSRRWRARGPIRTLATWLAIQILYLARVPPARLARLYTRIR